MKKKELKKCCFLDRDGVINKNYGHITNKNNFKILSKVPKSIKYLNSKNYLIIIITNQSVVGRGLITMKKLNEIHEYMFKYFKKKGAIINDIFVCPDHPKFGIGKFKKNSLDRKPNNGMLEKAIKKWGIDRDKSFMIGDQKTDYLCARKSKIKFYYKKKMNLFKQIVSIKLV
tara:strand:- start:987 stop:1502 length:516 start_codon:yes stop_codon:yes gene_type:complete